MNKIVSFFILFLIITSCKNNTELYFNQEPPSTTPELFAPSMINTDSVELNVVFNNDHTEIFFSRIVDKSFVIHHAEWIKGKWTDIKPLKMYHDSVLLSVACDPTITKDGKTMYFLGVDPSLYANDVSKEELYKIPPDIYMSKKVNGKWELATKVEFSVSTEYIETYPVVTGNGSLYFRSNRPSKKGRMNTYRAQALQGDKFDKPSILMDIEENAPIVYISSDESYAITNKEGRFQISFNENGKWTKLREIPLSYEKDWRYYCPYMSSDEKYFFFSRKLNNPEKKGWAGVEKGEVYWVSADILFKLK
ncbi:hypothetical protein [Marivirga arenosa]|uniref:WD40 repeat protein n=1 Tax=Marivirga arenosa TaxID=3059076 RepID=A0AA49GCB2_9BACT|nr:hypothetical protein [Marivirga sp. BKB1-2]WKK80712.2 hypothetical protein QYS47_27075 [Marivirga sp. BKB1-2]